MPCKTTHFASTALLQESECSAHSEYLHHACACHARSVRSSILVSDPSFTFFSPVDQEEGDSAASPGGGRGSLDSKEDVIIKIETSQRSRDSRLSVSTSSLGVSSSHPQHHHAYNNNNNNSFSNIMRNYVTVDTLVHSATSYTHQLANPTSGAGHRKFRREQERWLASPDQQQ